MGVYRSVTQPEIREKRVRYGLTDSDIEALGEKYITEWLRKKFDVPRKVKPEILRNSAGFWSWRFDWYEVETFN